MWWSFHFGPFVFSKGARAGCGLTTKAAAQTKTGGKQPFLKVGSNIQPRRRIKNTNAIALNNHHLNNNDLLLSFHPPPCLSSSLGTSWSAVRIGIST
jgi:hypothetical protein